MANRSKDATTAPKLWVVLARAYASLAAFVEQASEQEGIGLSDFMVLEALLHKGPMTISQIGEKVLLAAPSMTSAIDRLEKLDCVVRKTSSADRRIRVVELTSHGRRFISELYPRHAQSLEEIAGVLSPSEKEQLRSSLKKLGLAASSFVEEQSALTSPSIENRHKTTRGRSTRR
jgi:MarR family 2-MHQ and catechol resistance regulon transcriptional repressor